MLQAKRSADAAASHVTIAQDTAQRDLRAYIMVTDLTVSGISVATLPKLDIVLQNAGKTPAKGIRVYLYMGWASDDPLKVRVRFISGFQSGGTLAATNQIRLLSDPSPEVWTDKFSNAVISGKVKLVYAGIVVYYYVFKRRRLTTFFGHVLPKEIGRAETLRLSIGDRGNNAS